MVLALSRSGLEQFEKESFAAEASPRLSRLAAKMYLPDRSDASVEPSSMLHVLRGAGARRSELIRRRERKWNRWAEPASTLRVERLVARQAAALVRRVQTPRHPLRVRRICRGLGGAAGFFTCVQSF